MNKTSLSFVFLAMVMAWHTAIAEGGCPAGLYPQEGRLGWVCAPLPARQDTAGAQADLPASSDRWGAVTVTGAGQFIGHANDRFSEQQATEMALSDCRAHGGSSCKVVRTYRNQCVAVATSRSAGRIAIGPSRGEAMAMALDQCQKDGQVGCYPYYAACSLPPRTM